MARSASRTRERAPRRRSARSPETRERLLASALEAFGELGFRGATTREIARRAGVNLGLFSYYFDGKQALWKACVDRAFAELGSAFGAAVAETEGLGRRERLERLVRAFHAYAADHPEFVRLMLREGMEGGPRMEWLIDRHVRPIFSFVRAEQRRAGSELAFEALDPTYLFYLVVGSSAFFGLAPEVRHLTGRDTRSAKTTRGYSDAVVSLLLRRLEDPA